MTAKPSTDHLEPTVTDRGFKHLPPIPNQHGGSVAAYESSSAEGPHLWLRITSAVPHEPGEGVAHLTVDDARRLAEQLLWLCDHHYQGDQPAEGDWREDGR